MERATGLRKAPGCVSAWRQGIPGFDNCSILVRSWSLVGALWFCHGKRDGILEARPDVDEKIQGAVFLEEAGTHQRRVVSPKRGGFHESSDRLGLGEIGIRLVQIEIEAAAVDAAGAWSEVGVGVGDDVVPLGERMVSSV